MKELFRKHFGVEVKSAVPMRADGSARKLFRLTGGGRTAVGAENADLKENRAFLGFSRHFRKAGLPVPEIYAEDAEKGIYLEEDLGDMTLFRFLNENRSPGGPAEAVVKVYRKAVALLPKFQVKAGQGLDYSLCYPRPAFDKQSMAWDLNYFKYYFLRLAKIPFDEQALENDFKKFADFLLESPRDYFLYRDFQSRNIMVKDGEPWFLDYQGGRKGALPYDIASLLFDAKADLSFGLREDLLDAYLAALGEHAKVDRKAFLRHYPGFVYIRIMQAMGAYGLRGFYERKSLFLQSIPYAVRNLEYLLLTTELPIKVPALMEVFRRLVGSSYLRQFGNASLKLTVRVNSFSYKGDLPQDPTGHGGGFVFDCRALSNPGRDASLAEFTGKDPEVSSFLETDPLVGAFLKNALALVDQSVESYRKRNFTDLLVSFGCTGGRHRSVYCAERLAAHLREKNEVESSCATRRWTTRHESHDSGGWDRLALEAADRQDPLPLIKIGEKPCWNLSWPGLSGPASVPL